MTEESFRFILKKDVSTEEDAIIGQVRRAEYTREELADLFFDKPGLFVNCCATHAATLRDQGNYQEVDVEELKCDWEAAKAKASEKQMPKAAPAVTDAKGCGSVKVAPKKKGGSRAS